MEVEVQYLLEIIGKQTVELEMLRKQNTDLLAGAENGIDTLSNGRGVNSGAEAGVASALLVEESV